MNNEMDDFTSAIGPPNAYGLIQGEANTIIPGKRPLSSMTPTFVFKDGRLVLMTGSPGGPTIINTVLQIVTNVIDFRMNGQQAMNAPRISEQWMPDLISYELEGMPMATVVALKAKGHILRWAGPQGDGETIAIDPGSGVLFGASDPRNPDAAAVGY